MKRFFSTFMTIIILIILIYFINQNISVENNNDHLFKSVNLLKIIPNKNNHVILQKKDDAWITFDHKNKIKKVDNNLMKNFLSIIKNIKITKILTSISLNDAGLANNYKILKVNEKELFIGKITSDNKFVYASFNKKNIFLIDSTILKYFYSNYRDYLSKNIFSNTNNSDIIKLTIEYPGKKIFKFKKNNNKWNMVKPKNYICDKNIMKEYIENITSLKFLKIIEPPSKMPTDIYYKFTLNYNNSTSELTISTLLNDMFLCYDNSGNFGYISPDFERKILLSWYEFKLKKVFSTSYKNINDVTIYKNNKKIFDLSKNSNMSNSLIYDISNISFEKLISINKKVFKLNDTYIIIKLSSTNSKEELIIKKYNNRYYCCTNDNNKYFLIKKIFIDDILKRL